MFAWYHYYINRFITLDLCVRFLLAYLQYQGQHNDYSQSLKFLFLSCLYETENASYPVGFKHTHTYTRMQTCTHARARDIYTTNDTYVTHCAPATQRGVCGFLFPASVPSSSRWQCRSRTSSDRFQTLSSHVPPPDNTRQEFIKIWQTTAVVPVQQVTELAGSFIRARQHIMGYSEPQCLN